MIIFQEQKPYTKLNFSKKIGENGEDHERLICELENKKILKRIEGNRIVFSYVGIVLIQQISIFILPKYVSCNTTTSKITTIKDIIRLFKKIKENLMYHNLYDINLTKNDLEENIISLICYILDDYIENGIYKNEIDCLEINGNGDINWPMTLDSTQPLVMQEQWVYVDLVTNKNEINSKQFVTLLHTKIIEDCKELIENTGLNIILDYDIKVSGDRLESLHDREKIQLEVEKELQIQFNDRKRRVLKAIQLYLEQKSCLDGIRAITYGTNNFKWIWEVICSKVFDNEFISKKGISKYELFGIRPPSWCIHNSFLHLEEKNEIEVKRNRLTPDILKVYERESKKYLLILDAKYYTLRIKGEKIEGNPGIEDITKQYLYHTSLKKYIEENNIEIIINAFLLPNDIATGKIGKVTLDFMQQYSDVDIDLIVLDMKEVINLYCYNKTYDFSRFIDMISETN